MSRLRRFAPVAVVAAALLLSGCSTTVSLTPAAQANDPACAAVTVRLPDTVDGMNRVWTDAQATGAWTDADGRTTVLLTCGLAPSGPSTLVCESAGGVDWLIDDSEAPNYRFTTYGRTPALEVYLDYDVVSARNVLDALGTAVQQLPASGSECTERPSS
ncbi:MAG: hypothetical protein ABS62_09550 [Microbacterium sp. SCN 70-200]|uniref:DUF3515 family protein n=1 Tax=unclassified Microbacterium TaxID=2609290 RepID=UPI000869DA19|nr:MULTISPECIES: DUF3515 family protein [unclassified Microbacterium]MBN9214423.1 DUF3515 family protein [Microbacterium sp.]ODT40780.1 MAG: hypothetical protein ABS62_09550 [Microbacterium sp. SCN 70-200]OJV83778.1 MAG: hypothetical protein BGO46_12295 [Microbacterium sp. 70-16]